MNDIAGTRPTPAARTLRTSTGADSPPVGPHFGSAPSAADEDAETLLEAAQIIEDLRIHLAEFDRREQTLNSQLTALEREQRAFRKQRQQSARELDERTHVLNEREQSLHDLEATVTRRAAAIEDQEASFGERSALLEHQQAAREEQFQSEAEAVRAELAAERDELARQAAELEAEIESWTRRQADERREQIEAIERLHRERAEELQGREAAVRQREVDLAKRAKFQEDHLARLRSGLEERQREIAQQSAAQHVWIEQVESSIRLRLSHLRRFRALLDSREQLCRAAEQELAAERERHAVLAAAEQQELVEQQQESDEQRRLQESELRRRAELLLLREQELDRRSARMEHHAEQIERREQCVERRDAHWDQVVREVAEQTGIDLSGYAFDDDPGDVGDAAAISVSEEQRLNRLGAEQQLHEERQAFEQERATLLETIAAREARLEAREERCLRLAREDSSHEQKRQADRAQLRRERDEAETLIRELLSEIDSLLRVRHAG